MVVCPRVYLRTSQEVVGSCMYFEGRRRRGQPRMRWLDSITDSMDMNLRKYWETVEDRGAWRAAVHEVAKNRTDLGTELQQT